MSTTFEKSYFYGLIDRTFTVSESFVDQCKEKYPMPEGLVSTSSPNIKDLADNFSLDNFLASVESVEKNIASNNKPFLKLKLANSNGSFNGKIFSEENIVEEQIEKLKKFGVISFKGKVNEFPKGSGFKSVLIDRFEQAQNVNALDLVAKLDEDFEPVILETLHRLNNNVSPYRQIPLFFLTEVWENYVLSPAAKMHHHAYIGGLLRHVLEMIAIDDYLHSFENPADGMEKILSVIMEEHMKEIQENAKPEDGSNPKRYDRLIWGGDTISHITELIYRFRTLYDAEKYNRHITKAMYPFHDIGKLVELTYPGLDQTKTLGKLFPFASDVDSLNQTYNIGVNSITYDELGQLMGHMPIGSLFVQDFFKRVNFELNAYDLAHIHHLILSHHGKVEWNSTIVPQTAEAVLFHFVDYIGSRYEGELAKHR